MLVNQPVAKIKNASARFSVIDRWKRVLEKRVQSEARSKMKIKTKPLMHIIITVLFTLTLAWYFSYKVWLKLIYHVLAINSPQNNHSPIERSGFSSLIFRLGLFKNILPAKIWERYFMVAKK